MSNWSNGVDVALLFAVVVVAVLGRRWLLTCELYEAAGARLAVASGLLGAVVAALKLLSTYVPYAAA